MNTKRALLILAIILIALMLAQQVLAHSVRTALVPPAMASANYRLDWFTPLTGTGGPASSSQYAVNLTVGQTGRGASSSPNYQASLGYWYGVSAQHRIYLPLVLKS